MVAMTGWRQRNVGANSEYSQLHAVQAKLADDMIHSEQYTPARRRKAPSTVYVIFIRLHAQRCGCAASNGASPLRAGTSRLLALR